MSPLQYAKQVCGIRNQPVRNVEKRTSEQFELQELRKRVEQLEADRQLSIEMVEQSMRDVDEARMSCSEQLVSMEQKVAEIDRQQISVMAIFIALILFVFCSCISLVS